MKKRWILVAHRGGAKILTQDANPTHLSTVMEIDNPEGMLRNQELKSDRPGRIGSSNYAGLNPYAGEQAPKEHVLGAFVNTMVDTLEHACNERYFDELFLVAEPHLLGVLRKALSPNLTKKIAGELTKDLVHVEEQKIYGYLDDMLRKTKTFSH